MADSPLEYALGAFELTQRAFGQDDATQRRALAEKQGALEAALRFRQLQDQAQYQQGALANDQNRIALDYARFPHVARHMDAQTAGLYGDNRRADAMLQPKIEGVLADTANAQMRTQMLPRQLRVQEGELGVAQQNAGTAARNADSNRIEAGARAGLQGAQQAKVELDNEAQQRYVQRKQDFLTAMTQGPHAVPAGPRRDEVLSILTLGSSPDVPRALSRLYALDPTKGPSPEDRDAVAHLVEPYINRNVGGEDANGNVILPGGRFEQFVPVPGKPGKFYVDISVNKRAPDGQDFSSRHLVTKGRVPEDKGGEALEIDIKDMGDWMLGMRDLGEFGMANPEARQEINDIREAMSTSEDEVAYARNLATLQRRRATERKDTARLEKIDRQETTQLRKALESGVARYIDGVAGFSAGNYATEEGTADVPKIQQIKQARADLLSKIRTGVFDQLSLEELRNTSLDTLTKNQSLAKAIENYKSLVASAVPQGVLSQTVAAPGRGAIVNPRSQQ